MGAKSRKEGDGRKGMTVELGRRVKVSLGRPSKRTADVAQRFGLPPSSGEITILESAKLTLEPGKLVLILGPSGSGKSTALAQIERQCSGGSTVGRVSFSHTRAIVDGVAPAEPLSDALAILSTCALGEPGLWLRRFAGLSDGEKFRARLARAIGLHAGRGSAAPLLCDEFCSGVHRRVAKAISFNLRKLVRRRNLRVVVASSQDDILWDLQPDVVVRLSGHGQCAIERRTAQRRKHVSLVRRVTIEPGSKRDYAAFASMHYRASDELGFTDKIFVMRERGSGELLGIVVYAHPPIELSLRNQATNKRFVRAPRELNRHVRILRRLVVHPDVRGCGMGHYLVKKTLPLVGTRYVECLATMGEFNPVFEKAGMTRIGQYDVAPKPRAALAALKAMGVDPNHRTFPMQVARRPRVRKIVASVVFEWYAATTAGGERRVERQSPELLAQTFRGVVGSRPVYYLWDRNLAA